MTALFRVSRRPAHLYTWIEVLVSSVLRAPGWPGAGTADTSDDPVRLPR